MSAADDDFDFDLARYTVQLEKVILIAADAFRAGDAEFARRILYLREQKILTSMAEMTAAERTVH